MGKVLYVITSCLLLLLASTEAFAICSSDVLDLAQAGKKLFQGKGVCYGCHGRNADGKGEAEGVDQLNPKPTDLTDASTLRYPTDEARYTVIRNGIRGTGMPPFRGHLTDNEIRLLIEYLEVLRTGGC